MEMTGVTFKSVQQTEQNEDSYQRDCEIFFQVAKKKNIEYSN